MPPRSKTTAMTPEIRRACMKTSLCWSPVRVQFLRGSPRFSRSALKPRSVVRGREIIIREMPIGAACLRKGGDISSGKIWILALVLVSIGMCFGAALFHWNCSRLHNCEGPFDFWGSNSLRTDGGARRCRLSGHSDIRLFRVDDGSGNQGTEGQGCRLDQIS